ncbi:hypothetical protein EXIGLDRAFT_266231 [Exidia glandulosa HHB12029]|uniref:Uncharacterized protein n=1 Tax=Exidia glandulosa HHB12029 TaxID=1314781 RepID=A0A165MAA3_EXIGL|nr:hypothetical protein EXIGLDRAFT_266231 [Exidia glandulosa HHB12029]
MQDVPMGCPRDSGKSQPTTTTPRQVSDSRLSLLADSSPPRLSPQPQSVAASSPDIEISTPGPSRKRSRRGPPNPTTSHRRLSMQTRAQAKAPAFDTRIRVVLDVPSDQLAEWVGDLPSYQNKNKTVDQCRADADAERQQDVTRPHGVERDEFLVRI